ncbi:NERD domain-containing protein [Geodermatophilus sp. SYSU D00684]
MHVIEANQPNRTEREFGPALARQQGILVLCPFVAHGNRTRELDAVTITPHRITVVEGKGTRLTGQLVPALNGPWTVGGTAADFAGNKNPYAQARQAAQVLRGAARDAAVPGMPFVHFGVAVAGEGVTTETPALRLGDGHVCVMEDLPHVTTLPADRPAEVTLETAAALLQMLGVQVDGATLRRQGFTSRADVPAPRRAAPTGRPSGGYGGTAPLPTAGLQRSGSAGGEVVATVAAYLGGATAVEAVLYWAYNSVDSGLPGDLLRTSIGIAVPVVALFALFRVNALLRGAIKAGRRARVLDPELRAAFARSQETVDRLNRNAAARRRAELRSRLRPVRLLRSKGVLGALALALGIGLWELGSALQPSAFGYELTTGGQFLTAVSAVFLLGYGYVAWDRRSNAKSLACFREQGEREREFYSRPEVIEQARINRTKRDYLRG